MNRRAPQALRGAALSAALALAVSCTITAPHGPPLAVQGPRFPTSGELEELVRKAPAAEVFEGGTAEIPGWTLSGPLPDRIDGAPIKPRHAWEEMLVEVTAPDRDRIVPTGAMRCVARQTARFWLEAQALPSRAMRQAIAARCGSPFGDYSTAAQAGDVQPEASDRNVLVVLGPAMREAMKKSFGLGSAEPRSAEGDAPARPSLDVGIHYERQGERVLLLAVAQPRLAILEPAPIAADSAGLFRLRGRLLHRAASIEAQITRGAHGVAPCALDPAVRLPDFAITCELGRGDRDAWVEVDAFTPGWIIGDAVIEGRVLARGEVGDRYEQPPMPPGEAAPGADRAEALCRMLNGVRARAGLRPLSLEARQSRTAAELAPLYFAARNGQLDLGVADEVVLGLRAGWEVGGGPIRRGDFTARMAQGTADLRVLLALALARPAARRVLLSPEADRVAIGVVAQPEERMLGAVFGTYAPPARTSSAEQARAVVRVLARERAARGLPPPLVIDAAEDEAAEVAALAAGGMEPGQALGELVRRASHATAHDMEGFAITGPSLEGLSFPDALLRRRELRLAIAVVDHRPDGSPWTLTLALVAVAGDQAGVRNGVRVKPPKLMPDDPF